jgi:hypothetical protein
MRARRALPHARIAAPALLLTLVLGSCRTTASAPPGSTAFLLGDLEAQVGAGVTEVYDAAGRALAALGLSVDSSEASAIDASIDARTAEGKRVALRIEPVTGARSELTIRVGTNGDEELSRRIYERIQQEL